MKQLSEEGKQMAKAYREDMNTLIKKHEGSKKYAQLEAQLAKIAGRK